MWRKHVCRDGGQRGVAALSVFAIVLTTLAIGVPAAGGAVSAATPWAPMSTPNAFGAQSGALNGVSCPADAGKFCVAVGYDIRFPTSAPISGALAEVWNGTGWKVTPTPGTVEDDFYSVSCSSPTFCMAVGPGIADAWNGKTWSVTPNPLPSAPLRTVSCSSTECLAVGTVYATSEPVAEFWNGQSWTSIPPDGGFSGFYGVSCFAPGQCLVTGRESSTPSAMAELFDNGTWTDEPPPTPGQPPSLFDVSCQSATAPVSCMAHGDGSTAYVWNASTGDWTSTPSIEDNGGVSPLSCPNATECVAVGGQDLTKVDGVGALAEIWTGSSWAIMNASRLTSPQTHPDFQLSQVSCASPTFCVTVGSKTSFTGQTEPTSASWGTAP